MLRARNRTARGRRNFFQREKKKYITSHAYGNRRYLRALNGRKNFRPLLDWGNVEKKKKIDNASRIIPLAEWENCAFQFVFTRARGGGAAGVESRDAGIRLAGMPREIARESK